MRHDLTAQLNAAQQGDQIARESVVKLVYRELYRMASSLIRLERSNHTLQPTALVNETYLKLFDGLPIELQNRDQFFRIAATQMRRILVDHARKKKAQKRSGGDPTNCTDQEPPARVSTSLTIEELISLDIALTEFKELYPRAGSVVELRFFCGMTESETAAIVDISVSTLKREWEFARVWLYRRLNGLEGHRK
ncbi:MAG: sigma-70 family RNA polymerase sigma factor [Acidobacteria bacterium]|nr:sigma-70 family RNA polymerase sigma factor [Acidobacteriota bacterium]